MNYQRLFRNFLSYIVSFDMYNIIIIIIVIIIIIIIIIIILNDNR